MWYNLPNRITVIFKIYILRVAASMNMPVQNPRVLNARTNINCWINFQFWRHFIVYGFGVTEFSHFLTLLLLSILRLPLSIQVNNQSCFPLLNKNKKIIKAAISSRKISKLMLNFCFYNKYKNQTCFKLAIYLVMYSNDTGSSTFSLWLWHSTRAAFTRIRASAVSPDMTKKIQFYNLSYMVYQWKV